MALTPAGKARPRQSININKVSSFVDITIDSDEDIKVDDEPVEVGKTGLTRRESTKRKRYAFSESEEPEEPKAPRASQGRIASTPPGDDIADDDEEGSGLGEEEYEIESIVKSRFRRTRGKRILEYLIHWKDYGSDDDSWTTADQFDDDDPPVLEFYKNNPNAARVGQVAGRDQNPTNGVKAQSRAQGGSHSARTHARMRSNELELELDVVGVASSSRSNQLSETTSEVAELVDSEPEDDVRSSRRAPLKNYQLSESEDDIVILTKNTAPLKPKSTATNGKSSPVASSPVVASNKPRGGLLSFFGFTKTRGKENDEPRKSVDVLKEVKQVKPAVKVAPKPKKRKDPDDSGSDFVHESEAEDGSDGSVSAEEDEAVADVGEDEEEDYESDAPKPKKNPGWNRAKVAVKRSHPNVASFHTGITPLRRDSGVKTTSLNMSEDLPPVNDIETMFDHLVSRIPDVTKLVDQLNGRKLRVATMCSGTESPLLALNLIAKAIKSQHGATLAFDHVFSCEIEPFKQAYIERNFAPPILFRDVTELGGRKAHTAYGSLVEVPGNVDILIAGTSCVDYSNLNNKQQEIEANGESGRTFRGMLQWVNKHQPPVVILENVCMAPWDKVVQYFDEINYDAQHCRLDTKEFYIPHTRTRVYLFATPRGNSSKPHLAHKWEKTVKDLRRPWSAPFESFLLHTDDTHIHRARLDLACAKEQKDGVQRKPTDWNRCESRHQRARQEEELGIMRPLTSWQEAGVCKGVDWTWNDWLLTQTERVLDLLEISTLRMAKDGIDSGFKSCIWNVSQNVDRQAGTGKTALAPCLTPNMIAWVTNRGGPVTGREALALQGIPVRELLLTSESEDQLADLAGNAMTTTVVGASMLAALRVAIDKLSPGESAEADAAKIDKEIAVVDEEVAKRVIGETSLEEHELDLAKVAVANLEEMLDLAERSSRHCQCEGQNGTATPIIECQACGYRACKSCGGRPDHQYEACKNVRVEPTEFEQRFKDLLPMRVQIAGLNDASLSALRAEAETTGKGEVDPRDWTLWTKAVLEGTVDAEFRFRHLKRGFTWTAVYEAPHANLDLVLQAGMPEWRLTIKAPVNEPVNSRFRSLLLHPVARLRFDNKGQDVLCGPWELCVPTQQTFQIEISGTGDLVPSWQASLGLLGAYSTTKRWSQIEMHLPEEAAKALDRDVSGVYDLLPKCGQAMNSLHKRQSENSTTDLFFFLDPTRCGDTEDDKYVFSTSTERLDYGTERAVIATLHSKWRESAKQREKVKMDVHGGWIVCPEAHLTAVGGKDIAVVPLSQSTMQRDTARYAVPPSADAVSVSLDTQGCTHATALLSCSVPLGSKLSEPMWREGKWGEVDLLHQGNAAFAQLAWITERLPPLDALASWTPLAISDLGACDRCAPRPPKIHWIKRDGKKNKNGGKTKSSIVAFEDKLEAGRYEHALKNRPAPFVVQLRRDGECAKFRIGLNIVSLAHRALSRLPADQTKGSIELSWKLTPGQVANVPRPPRVFVIPSNKRDPAHDQPEGFLLDLRIEQLRSLRWMLEQERATGKTNTFVEEEISEAALPSLGWRAEGKAERPVMVRGGIIADQVGYGKTIISLALIAEGQADPSPEPAPAGLIDIKATLIVVPGHLSKQWPSEIARFTGNMFKTIVIQNIRDLQSKSIADLAKADIIVMACELLEADSYWQRFEYLSAQPEGWLDDKQGGRFFADRLDTAMQSMADQVEMLQSEGAEAAQENRKKIQTAAMEEAQSKRDAHKAAEFGKRMKGQAYRDKYDVVEPSKKKTTKNNASRWDPDEEESEEETESVPLPNYREATGLESLNSSSVKKNHKLLACPLMHMFRFRRVIADEFTYLEKRGLTALLRLSSSYKWVLSGTPPVGDFPAIRSIAAFMGIHLGVGDDGEGTAQTQKARAKEQTAAERFHAFREVHSAAWHRRRDDLAQEFLNVFVRQNIAEIDDIPTVEHVHEIQLPAAECAVYLELEHHLQALEMNAETKFKDVDLGDRNARLEEALADSRTAEEALLKRCCHFTLDLTDKTRDAKSAQEACEHISGARTTQLANCEKDLYVSINKAVTLNTMVKKKGSWTKDDRHHFKEWVEYSFDLTKHQGDAEAAERLVSVLKRSGFKGPTIPSEPVESKSVKLDKGAKLEDIKWRLREQTHLLRRLSKELVARVRSLRFFEVVRKIQRGGDDSDQTLESSECDHRPSTHPDTPMAVLSCCGHVACLSCMKLAADEQKCVASAKCNAAVRHTNIVKVASLGIEGQLSSGRYGAKLRTLVDLIHSIPSNERVLVFLQWEDLAHKISEALDDGNIKHVTLSGTVTKRANTLDLFQHGDDTARVLLLKMNDASAAGSNLTTANHAIFLGPLFTPTLYNYRAVETQAIGRVRRYGQSKKVHVHRLLAVDTIDMAMFNTRRGEESLKPDYVAIPKEAFTITTGKASKAGKRKSMVAVEIDSPRKKRASVRYTEDVIEIDYD